MNKTGGGAGDGSRATNGGMKENAGGVGDGSRATNGGAQETCGGTGDGSEDTNGGTKKTLEFHPLADLFPLMEGEDFERLVDDIRKNGIHDEIVMLEGKILDGRNRYRAGLASGMFPADLNWKTDWTFTEFGGSGINGGPSGDPLAWVLSKNLHRRHLSSSQRGLLAARLADMKSGRPSKTTAPIGEVSRQQAAQILNVGQGSVDRGKKVLTDGAKELVTAVKKGEVSLGAAAEIATLPIEEQVQAIESADPKAFAKVARARRDRKTAEKKQRRMEREVELGRHQLSLPDRKFGVIYADPEWKFQPYSEATGMDRAADNHYPTSNVQDILERRVQDISAPDAVLFLWATVPMLEDALDVMGGWDFKYRSHFVWSKDRAGTGYWNRNAHEFLLVGTRGKIPAPAPGTQWPSVIEAPVGHHSEKPDIFYFLIESYFPSLPKIELNARKVRDGWCAWGDEVETSLTQADFDRGISSENSGMVDASHLPLLKSHHSLPPHKGKGEKESVGDAGEAGSAEPQKVGTGFRTRRSAKSQPDGGAKKKKPKPQCVEIDVDGLHLLARFGDFGVKFYTTEPGELFPAECGWLQIDYLSGPFTAPDEEAALGLWRDAISNVPGWFVPTTIYRMGRTGPVPVISKDAKERGAG